MIDINKLSDIQDDYISEDTWKIVPKFNVRDIAKKMSVGDYSLKDGNIFSRVLMYFTGEIFQNSLIMLQIIIISIICGLVVNLQASFNKEGISNMAFFACYVYITGILVANFTHAFNIGKDVIDNLVISMQAMVPILSTMLITSGNVSTAVILQPSILVMVQIVAIIIQKYVLPFMYLFIALTIVNNISEKEQVSKLVTLFKEIIKWGLCLFLTVFISILSIQGFGSAYANGIGQKTAKFFLGSFIPVVGSVLSDAYEMVIGASSVIRNAAGVIGLILLVLVCLIPIIKIAALIFIYKITAALIEPVADERISKCIAELSDILVLVFAIIVTVTFMFIISICIMIGAANFTTMLI